MRKLVKNMSYKVISFHTEPHSASTYYTKCAQKFKENCVNIGVDHEIDQVPSRGDYYKNTRFKPKYILNKLNELKTDVLWVDIDCEIVKLPNIPDDNIVFVGRNDSRLSRHLMVHSYAIYFKYCESNISFINDWIKKCDHPTQRKVGDHDLLVKTLIENRTKYGLFEDDPFKLKVAPRLEVKK